VNNMKITFKTKTYINALNKETIALPKKINRTHVVKEPLNGQRWDGIINSNMLPNAISRKIDSLKLQYINLDSLPDCVTIEDGFLKQVTIDLGSSY